MKKALPTPPTGHYRLQHIAKFEAWKVLTLRSTVTMLGITVVAVLAGTALEARADLHRVPGFYVGFDPTQESLTGLIVAALIAGVFGALAITGEYSSGTIRTTLAAAPRRFALVMTKISVMAVAAVIFSDLVTIASFLLGQAILSGGGAPHVTLGSPGALRAVTVTGLFLALLVLMSFGFGLVLRSTAGAITAFAGVLFVLQFIAKGSRYTPTSMMFNSITVTVRGHAGVLHPLSPDVALMFMALYAAIALAVGVTLFVRRDA